MYKQSFFFYLHRLVGSCAPLLHRGGSSQAAHRRTNPIVRPAEGPNLSAFASWKGSKLEANTAGSPCSSPSSPRSPRIRARYTTKPPERRPPRPRTHGGEGPARAQPRPPPPLQPLQMPPERGGPLGQRLREPSQGRAPEESAAPGSDLGARVSSSGGIASPARVAEWEEGEEVEPRMGKG